VTATAIRRLCLAVDVDSYSGRTRARQLDVQNRLLWMMVEACRAGGVNPARCDRQDSGDGQILLFPGGINEATVLPSAVLGLLTGLHRINNPPGIGGRIRLRISLGQGAIEIGATGFVAPAVVTVCRLLESSELRAALTANQSCDAACIVTSDLYDDMFVQGYGGLPANVFRSVHISNPAKKFETDAWLSAPDQVPLLATVPAYPIVTGLERKQLSRGSRVLLDMGAAAGLAWALFAASKRGAPIPGVHAESHGGHANHDANHSEAQHGDPGHGAPDSLFAGSGADDAMWSDEGDGAHHDFTHYGSADEGLAHDGSADDSTDGYDTGDYGGGLDDQSFSSDDGHWAGC
jgi:hypothetical protein